MITVGHNDGRPCHWVVVGCGAPPPAPPRGGGRLPAWRPPAPAGPRGTDHDRNLVRGGITAHFSPNAITECHLRLPSAHDAHRGRAGRGGTARDGTARDGTARNS